MLITILLETSLVYASCSEKSIKAVKNTSDEKYIVIACRTKSRTPKDLDFINDLRIYLTYVSYENYALRYKYDQLELTKIKIIKKTKIDKNENKYKVKISSKSLMNKKRLTRYKTSFNTELKKTNPTEYKSLKKLFNQLNNDIEKTYSYERIKGVWTISE